MEDAKRKSIRRLKVERSFELSRLEGDVIESVYEHVFPTVRGTPMASVVDRNVVCDEQLKTMDDKQNYGTGA